MPKTVGISEDKKNFVEWVNQKLKDYLYDEKETRCHVDMYFEAGKESNSKHRTWQKDDGTTKLFEVYSMYDLCNKICCPNCGLSTKTYSENGHEKNAKYCRECGCKFEAKNDEGTVWQWM